jgi:hypothetical protein
VKEIEIESLLFLIITESELNDLAHDHVRFKLTDFAFYLKTLLLVLLL